MQRPDLSSVPADVLAYIEFLEGQAVKPSRSRAEDTSPKPVATPIPAEMPGRFHLISVSQNGMAKRTQRHLYERQHRGGVGISDLETPLNDQPALIQQVQEGQPFLLLTDRARAFRLPADRIPPEPVRGRGIDLMERLPLEPGEQIAALLPVRSSGYVLFLSASGVIRSLRHHIFGEHMKPGTAMFNFSSYGPLAYACWSPGDVDIFVATRQGMAIRFSDRLIPPQGGQAIRLQGTDQAVAAVPVRDNEGVFLVTGDGRGTIRSMSTFAANKSMGGTGKIAMRTEKLAAAAPAEKGSDLFILSSNAKIIRFPVSEVPESDGPVQGVQCMEVRSSKVISLAYFSE